MESLDMRRLPLSTVITVVDAWPGDVGLVEVEDLDEEVKEDLDALWLNGDDDVWVLFLRESSHITSGFLFF